MPSVAGGGSGTSGGAPTGGRSAFDAVQRLHQSMAELRELSGITSKAMTIVVQTITTVVTATSVGITTATATTGIS